MEAMGSIAAKVLLPLVSAVSRTVTQLRAERAAATRPFPVQAGLLDQRLKEILGRFRGGSADDVWWRYVLAEMQQKYMAPDFFKVPSVRTWLGQEDVQEGIVSLAKANVMGQLVEGEDKTRRRLSESFSKHTGEPEGFAEDAINVTVAVLTAGYMASIPKDQRSFAGMFQVVSSQLEGINRKLDRAPERDAIIQSMHAKVAGDELSAILTSRIVGFNDAIERVNALWLRVNGGDLSAVPEPMKTRVRYWVARLRASTFEVANDARSIRNGLSHGDTDENLHVLDALIMASDGDADGALQKLREDNSPDARSVLLALLVHFRGELAALDWCADLKPDESPEYFTAIGWREWAVCMGSAGKWKEAADGLKALESNSEWAPGLAMIDGVVNAALLLPEERRKLVFDGAPIYDEVAPNLSREARAWHGRAKECFGHVVRSLSITASKGVSEFLGSWCTWVDLMDPGGGGADIARSKIRERLESGDVGGGLVSLAWAFGIEFDPEKLRARLNRHERLGGLGDEERLAEYLLNHRSMSAREFATYVEEQMERLDQVISKSVMTVMLFDALLEDGQIERARAMVEKRRHHLDEDVALRMDTALSAHGGNDLREHLEGLCRQSDGLIDLKNLIGYLMTVNDRKTLGPLLRELFDRESTLEHAFLLVRFLGGPPPDYGAILEFLEFNPTVADESEDMKSALAWALFGRGRIAESRKINDALLASRQSDSDLALDLNIAVATGDWERLPAIVDKEWARRSEHDAELLITLARLASQVGQSTERAIELARLAATKAPANPQILIEAFGIYVKLGRDADADPLWLDHAVANSSAKEGPVWRTDLQQLVNDWLPRTRARNERIDRMLMGGEVPLALAAGVFNTPLSRILLASQGENMRDGRSRAVVPIISGARNRIDLEEGWTVGVDLTSAMVLSRLGLLKTVLDALDQVKIAPNAMEHLFADRAAVRFHQPALVDSARDVRRLIDQGRIELVDRSVPPSTNLAEEVGSELATLLEACADDQGVVVCVMPIPRAGSLIEEVADTSSYDELILSPADLCSLAHQAGLTDADQDGRAKTFLASQGQTPRERPPQSSLSGPIFVDSLALSYLQSAHVLGPLANAGLDLRIHSDVADEMKALIETGDDGEELAESVESIRETLRAGMESGKVTLLPLPPERIRESGAPVGVDSLAGLLFGSAECDALCIDDRFVNTRVRSEDRNGRSIPVVCVLDVLRHLHACRAITDERYWGSKHKLRQAGFAFIPAEADELLKHLLAAERQGGQMLESAELRVIRQTVNRVNSLEQLSRVEACALGDGMALACREVIQRLWSNPELEIQAAGSLCSWVWRHLGMVTFLLQQGSEVDGGVLTFRDGFVRRLSLLMLPPIMDSVERRSAYKKWLEESVLVGLLPANDDVVEEAATAIRLMIKGSGKHERVLSALFLECMPDNLRARIVNEDPAFAERAGFTSTSLIEVAGSLNIAEADLMNAAIAIYAGAETVPLTDIKGARGTLSRASDDETLVATWLDAQGETRRVQVPELALVSENAQARMRVLNRIVGQLGPTAQEPRGLLEHASSRRLTKKEFSVVFGEMARGVAAVQSRLVSKIAQGWQANVVDLVPPSRGYWVKFCGPVPDGTVAETYIRDQLVPYRKGLIEADLRTGLDICCLGALWDDLSLGAWLSGIDDETVWNAVTSMPVRGNPIALLAVLDVALYRAGDDRFRRLADDTIGMLLDDHLGLPANCDPYRLFEVLADFELNRLALVEGAANYPGFWRRMCAWMQAGLIIRTAVGCSAVPEVGHLEEWCKRQMVPAGSLRRLADCRAEPEMLGPMRSIGSLRHEVLARLGRLKERHERAGRGLPKSTEIESALSWVGLDGPGPTSAVPGPAAMHLQPREPIPDGFSGMLDKDWAGDRPTEELTLAAHLSQCFVLRDSQLEKVREAVASIADKAGSEDFRSIAAQLHAASIIAATARDIALADSIAAAIGTLLRRCDLRIRIS